MSYRVIDYLRKRRKLQYYVFISAVANYDNVSVPTNVLVWETEYMYHSVDLPNQSLRLDFPIESVYIKNFSLKSAINRDPYNWNLEGSTDAVNFVTLYKNVNTKLCVNWSDFDGYNTIGCLDNEIKEYDVEIPGYYKSIRIRQTGEDSNNQTILALSGIEIIGHIKILKHSCHFSSFFSWKFSLFFIFVLK